MKAAAAIAWVLALAAAGPGAARAETIIQLDGSANLSYATTTTGATGPAFAPSSDQMLADVRPGLILQVVGDRVAWRVGYLFDGSMNLADSSDSNYSNAIDLALMAQLSPRAMLAIVASGTQGSQVFQQSARSADVGQPGFRAPGNPSTVQGTFSETIGVDAAPGWRFSQVLAGLASAQQDDLEQYGVSLNLALTLDHLAPTNSYGVEVQSTASELTPLAGEGEPVTHYFALFNSVLARWSRDFNPEWNGLVSAGVEQVLSLAASQPLAILPTGNLIVRYTQGRTVIGATYMHAAITNLEVGTVSSTDSVTVRGTYELDRYRARVFSASAGIVRSEPIGETAAVVSAGTGYAVQADVGLTWELYDGVLATARYSLAYQFDQAGGAPASVDQIVLVGLTARYTNVRRPAPFPALGGQRVDGTDGAGFTELHGAGTQ